MQHHKLNFLICQNFWLISFIMLSPRSERQKCFLCSCIQEGNLFPLPCSAGWEHGCWGMMLAAGETDQWDECILGEALAPGHYTVVCVTDLPQLLQAVEMSVLLSGSPQHKMEPSAALRSKLLHCCQGSSYEQEHNTQISNAVPHWAGWHQLQTICNMGGEFSLQSWMVLTSVLPQLAAQNFLTRERGIIEVISVNAFHRWSLGFEDWCVSKTL